MVHSIPTYCISIYLLPLSLDDEIEKMMNSLRWGTNTVDKKGINWLSWEKMVVRKDSGGLGLCDLHGFNLTMLGKQ